jgi:hypothetical protein
MTDLAPPVHTADLKKLTSDGIKRLLRTCAQTMNDTDLKQCVMQARQDGHLTDDETRFFIQAWGLTNA